MRPGRENKDLPRIAARVMEDLEEAIKAMHRAAEQIASGRAEEKIDDSGYQLYLARKDPRDSGSRVEGVLCALDYDRYYDILEKAAEQFGLCLEQETRLEIAFPESEFEENMVTGGFEKFKGLEVEHHNQCLEELIVAVCRLLQERGLAVACVPDEDVIFYLPLSRG